MKIGSFTFEDLEKICVIRLLEALSHPPSKQVKAALPPRWRGVAAPTHCRSRGVPWHFQILADQITLSQTEGADYAHQITNGTLGFSDLPTALQHHDGFHTQANQGLGKRLRFSNWRDMYHNKSFLFLLMLTTTVGSCCFSGNKLKLLSHFEFASFLRMKSPLDLKVTLKLKNL